MTDDRLTTPNRRPEDLDAALRPKTLDEFVGQKAARENLRVFIDAAKGRGDALDHVLFFGPPGLGKTTLAQIIARELGVGFRATSGPVIAKSGDLAALLTNLEDGDVLFIDEIHRLSPAVEEILYPAMEDRALDLMIGEGPSARSVRIDLPKFTLVGATTRQGLITTPLRDRFGIPVRLTFYSVEELEQVVRRAARLLGLALTEDGAREIARRSRGTPRIAGRLLRRVRDFAQSAGRREVDAKVADAALTRMEVDQLGLDAMDRRYLTMIADIYSGGPVGVETLAAGLSEPRDTIEEVIEPYLIQLGLIARTARGRCLNGPGWTHLGLPQPKAARPACSIRQMRGKDEEPYLTRARLASPAPAPAQPPSAPAAPRRRARLCHEAQLALPSRPRRRLRRAACRPPRSIPTAMARSARSRPPPTRRSTASTSIRPSRAIPGINSDLTPGAEEQAVGRGPVRPLRLGLPDLRADLPPGHAGRIPRSLSGAGSSAPISTSPMATSRRLAPLSRSTTIKGRPFVLIGHSQGTIHLTRLLAERDRGHARRRRACSRRC